MPATIRIGSRKPHVRLAAQRAHFRDVSGWECPGWYAPEGQEPIADRLTFGRANWFPWWEAEHHACRDGVIAMDMSFMGKFLVQGRDAGRFLNYISANEVNGAPGRSANEVNGAPGRITYTQWLNEDAGIEADLTISLTATPRPGCDGISKMTSTCSSPT
jgi:4-methylaminobutanoate oxidase (formaldehyde-forming)